MSGWIDEIAGNLKEKKRNEAVKGNEGHYRLTLVPEWES